MKKQLKQISKKTLEYMPIIFAFIMMVMIVPNISAIDCPTYKQAESVALTAVCDNCTQVNLTKVIYPNSSFALLGEFAMTKNVTNFNYTFQNTATIGTYYYGTCGDLNGVITCEDTVNRCFTITPSGQSGTANIVFIVLIILFAYIINLIGYFKGEITLTILTGMFLMFLGVYLINNGLIIFRDDLTRYFAYLTIGWGMVSTFVATMELIGE